jgi:hypothetical protein
MSSTTPSAATQACIEALRAITILTQPHLGTLQQQLSSQTSAAATETRHVLTTLRDLLNEALSESNHNKHPRTTNTHRGLTQAHVAAISPSDAVSNDKNLLNEIFAFLVISSPYSAVHTEVKEINRYAEVNRQWRNVSRSSFHWQRIAADLMPLQAASPGWHGSFETLAAHGKVLVQKKMILEDNLLHGLDMTWEIFDAMDDLRIYSASGPLHALAVTNTIKLSIPVKRSRE